MSKRIVLPGGFSDALGDLLKVKPPSKPEKVAKTAKPTRKAAKKR